MSREAVDAWRGRIRNDTLANYYLSMAVVIWHQEGASVALRWIEEARQYPAHGEATALLGREALAALGRDAEAEGIHTAALAADPHYEVVALREVATIYASSPAIPTKLTEAAFDRALATAGKHGADADALLIALERACFLLAQHPPGVIDTNFAALLSASGTLSETVQKEVATAAAELTQAALLADRGDTIGGAIDVLEAVAQPDDLDPHLINRIAAWLPPATTAGPDTAQLRRQLTVLIERIDPGGPGTAQALAGASAQAFRAGDPNLGELAASRALAADPTLAFVRPHLARARWMRGDRQGALATLEAAIATPGLRALFAMYLVAAGRTSEARQQADSARAEGPTDSMVQNCAGFALIADGGSAEVVKWLEPLGVRQAGPVSCLAIALDALGRGTESISLLDGLLETPPSVAHASFQVIKAAVLEGLGRSDEADDWYRRAADAGVADEFLFLSLICPTLGPRVRAGLRRVGMTLADGPPGG